MTESNGVRGLQAEAWANRQPLGIPEPQGPFYPQPQQASPQPPSGSQEPDGFTAGSFWGASYDFRPVGINAHGDIPIPSQAKIDNYGRKTALLDYERQRIAREILKPFERLQEQGEDAERFWNAAREAGDAEAAGKWRAELDRIEGEVKLTEEMFDSAQERKDELLSGYKDAVSNLCSGKPTRKQLEKLSEPDLYGFMNYLGGKLAPNS